VKAVGDHHARAPSAGRRVMYDHLGRPLRWWLRFVQGAGASSSIRKEEDAGRRIRE